MQSFAGCTLQHLHLAAAPHMLPAASTAAQLCISDLVQMADAQWPHGCGRMRPMHCKDTENAGQYMLDSKNDNCLLGHSPSTNSMQQ
jgi:hypothetical protein